MMSLELVVLLLAVSLFIYYLYYQYCFTYWSKKGVPTSPPIFPGGNINKSIVGAENLYITIQNLYHEFKTKGHKHGGIYFFNGPVYLPVDPELVKAIMTTDFDHFVDRGMHFDEESSPLSAHLFSITGTKWKTLRAKLSLTFTSGKLKTMYEIFLKITGNFVETCGEIAERGEDINIKNIATNFTCDIISSTALGLDVDTLKYPENEVAMVAFRMFKPSRWLFYKSVVLNGFQNPGNIIRGVNDNKVLQRPFIKLVRDIVKYRDENKTERKDFLTLLLEVRDKEGLSFNDIVAQSFLFFLAGFETSSQTISMCIHQLAHNPELQDRLRREIFNNIGTDCSKFSYEDILKLPYLDQVFNETLRLYPVLGFLNRICVKPYKVPGTDVTIDAGTPVLISTLALQRDPEFYPDPLKFDPERFSKDASRVPFSYMPFGEGPRFCIGMRYGILQTKLGIAALISRFKFSPSPKTPELVEFDKLATTLAMTPQAGISVKIEKL